MLGRVFAALGGLVMHYRPTMDIQRMMLPALLAASSIEETVVLSTARY